jgi:hypothetical protein
VFDSIVIVFESRACVIGRVNVDAPYLPPKLRLKASECQQVVAEDQPVVEDVLIGDSVFCVVGLLRIFQ